MRRFFVLMAAALVLAQGPARALEVPAKPEGYISDYARLLSESARQNLERILADFERATSNQVAVAIFQSLEGESLEDISIRLAEAWKIGSKKNDNGVILLIFKEDRQVRIEVGYGLEGALPDAVAGQIIRREIAPAFREGRYEEGVAAGVNAILRAVRGEYQAEPAAPQDRIQEIAPYLFFILAAFFLAPLLSYLLAFAGSVVLFGAPAGFLAGALAVVILAALRKVFASSYFGETLSGRPGGFWGGGGFSGGRFGGGGGFSGGGGGGFGGGGASGRW